MIVDEKPTAFESRRLGTIDRFNIIYGRAALDMLGNPVEWE